MRTNRCFRKSKKVQKKRKQRKTKRTKKSKTTRTRGGFHIIEPDVDEEIDMEIDENILPGLRDIMDDMISLPNTQKEDIFTLIRIFIDLRNIYAEIRPDEVIGVPHETSQHEKTNILISILASNMNNVTRFIGTMIDDTNDIDAAQIVHDYIMAQIRPCVLLIMADQEDFENTFDYLNNLIDERSPYQRQFKTDFEILLNYQIRFTDLLISFIEVHCKELGRLCLGDNYNENDYIMPLSIAV